MTVYFILNVLDEVVKLHGFLWLLAGVAVADTDGAFVALLLAYNQDVWSFVLLGNALYFGLHVFVFQVGI